MACKSCEKPRGKEGGVGGGVGTSREISFFSFSRKNKLISDLTKGGRDMIYLPSSELQHKVQRLFNTSPAWLRGTSIVCV